MIQETQENTLLLRLVQNTTADYTNGDVPYEVIIEEARVLVHTFCKSCSCSRQNPYKKGDDKPSIRYGNDYMNLSRKRLSQNGYAYSDHHLLQIMAVFYVLMRRPNMRSQYRKFEWYINTMCEHIDANLFQEPRNTISRYREEILQTAVLVDSINQPDLFGGPAPIIVSYQPKTIQRQTIPTVQNQTVQAIQTKTIQPMPNNIQVNNGDYIAAGGTKNITKNITNNYYYAQPPSTVPNTVQVGDTTQGNTTQSGKAGRPFSGMFIGADGQEDRALRRQEQAHVEEVLKAHCLYSRQLCCEKNDTLNRYVVGFVRYWREKKMIPRSTPTAAIYRFLTEDCGLESSVQQQAITNRWSDYLREENYGMEEFYEIKSKNY